MSDELMNIRGVDKIVKIYNDNRKLIQYVAIGVILALAAIWYYQKKYKPAREMEAYGQLFMAEKYFRSDSTRLALEGDGNYPGTREIADKYGSTKAGNLAKFYTGRLLMRNKEFKEADNYLKKVSFSDDIMPSMVLNLRGDCYSDLGDYSKAASFYKKALKKSENDATRPYTLEKAALATEASGKLKDAIKYWEELRNDFNGTEVGSEAEKQIFRLEAILASSK
jgi:tetratricopeptide (TPR) repeat protein